MMTLSLEEAFISLEGATELPSLDTVIVVMQKCRKEKNLVYAKRVHMCMHDNGLETHLMLGNYLVPMFVECGSMSDAQQVFYRSVQPNEHSWTSLIQGYVEYGESQNAFNLFQKMQKVSVSPSGYTFLALLKACGQLRCVEKGQAIHLDIAKQGCEEEPFVGNHLVDMYAKCGSLAEAQKVFDELATHDVILWTALVARYVEHGLSEEALNCLEQMQQEGLSPNDVTFVCSLKACGNLGAVDKGRDLHAEIVKEGFEGDIYIGNTLVDFYVKCGSLVEAREVFDELLVRDIVSWTALISGYAEHGLGQEALNCLDKMHVEGMFPNSVTYFSILKACGTIGAIDRGQVFHTAIVKEGFERDHLVSSTLVDFYSKCGLLAEAQAVFDELPVRSVVLWTALIAGYADHGLGEKALSCLAQMQLQGVNADAVTFICTLKVCGSLGVIDRGLHIHAEISKDGFEKDTFVGSTLVDIYAKCGFLAEARAVLEELPVQCVVSWTALIDGYAEHGFGEEALKCLTEMQLEGLSPNAFTFVCGLKASAIIQSIHKGRELHMGIVKNGFEKDLFICSTLVDMYSKCGFLVEAQKIFDEVAIRDVVLWNSLITGYAECSLSEKALDCLKQMQVEGISLNVASWNAILLGCAEHGESEKTLELYVRMLDQALSPDGVTIVSVLKACGNTSAVETGKIIHVQVDSVGGLDSTEVIIATALIDMYSKCGSMRDAQLVFDEMPKRDLMVWTTLITGYARRGRSERVFDLFEKMREEGIKPDEYTFLSVLTACSHAGHVDEGLKYFEIMSKEFGITPNLIHRNCMVDIVSRAGQLNEAVVMLKKMPFQPDIVTWKTVLAACHKCANVELGRQAFEHVACLDEKDGAAFILMSNIYADANMWEDARKIETMRLNIQAGKEPGKSWVEIDGLVHKFLFEDTGHFQSKNIYAKLERFSSRMEEEFDHLLSQGTLYNSKKNAFFKQSEHLAVACGLINSHKETPIRIAVYLRVFDSSHAVMAWISKVEERMILCRDASRLHVFEGGMCSCRE